MAGRVLGGHLGTMLILKMGRTRSKVGKLALDRGLRTPRPVYSLSACPLSVGEKEGWENNPGPGWGFENTSSYNRGQFS